MSRPRRSSGGGEGGEKSEQWKPTDAAEETTEKENPARKRSCKHALCVTPASKINKSHRARSRNLGLRMKLFNNFILNCWLPVSYFNAFIPSWPPAPPILLYRPTSFFSPAVFFFRFVSLHLSASSFLLPLCSGDVNCEPDVQSGINQSRRVKGSRDEREGGQRRERREPKIKGERPPAKSQNAD